MKNSSCWAATVTATCTATAQGTEVPIYTSDFDWPETIHKARSHLAICLQPSEKWRQMLARLFNGSETNGFNIWLWIHKRAEVPSGGGINVACFPDNSTFQYLSGMGKTNTSTQECNEWWETGTPAPYVHLRGGTWMAVTATAGPAATTSLGPAAIPAFLSTRSLVTLALCFYWKCPKMECLLLAGTECFVLMGVKTLIF